MEAVYPAFIADLESRGEPIPQNQKPRTDGTKLFHTLDRAVIEFAIKLAEEVEGRKFETVRCAFWEGGPAFHGSEIAKQSHIQIDGRNPDCVLGYFKPKRICPNVFNGETKRRAMTAKTKAAIDKFQSAQFALRDKVVARLAEISSADRLKVLVSAGILTKKGKLTPSYRPKRAAA